jgi:short-chain Z-isoprenyl diphosphate synthase
VSPAGVLLRLYPRPVRDRWGPDLEAELRGADPFPWPSTLLGIADMWLHPALWPAGSRSERRRRAAVAGVVAAAVCWFALHDPWLPHRAASSWPMAVSTALVPIGLLILVPCPYLSVRTVMTVTGRAVLLLGPPAVLAAASSALVSGPALAAALWTARVGGAVQGCRFVAGLDTGLVLPARPWRLRLGLTVLAAAALAPFPVLVRASGANPLPGAVLLLVTAAFAATLADVRHLSQPRSPLTGIDWKAYMFHPLRTTYKRHLRHQVAAGPLPGHVGLIMDGNRRWARQQGLANTSHGHRYGAEHAEEVLSWCESLGIRHVTVYVCSTENLTRRDDAEVAFLMEVIEELVTQRLARHDARWQVHIAGMLDALPDGTARALKHAQEATRSCTTGAHVTLAIGYGGRQEVVDALRDLLHERAESGDSLLDVASTLTVDDIARHLYTAGQPDPDLVIRTSGEQRLSNFLLWQSAYSELYFCEAYWPAFREIDFLRALRSYAARQRRYGG